MKKILVVGSLNMDMVVNVPHHPKTGETILSTNNIEYFPGGKGANQAYAVASLNGKVTMLGVVGNDDAGETLIGNLRDAGADVSRIGMRSDVHSGTAIIAVNNEGNNSIIVIPGSNNLCDVDYIRENEDVLEAADYVLIQMEIPMKTLEYVVTRASTSGKTVILNPAPAQKLSDEILAMTDFITPNETELEILSGMSCDTIDEIKSAAEYLIEKGVSGVVVTLGEKGAIVLDKYNAKIIPGRSVKAVDTTAAGDCFNGAFAVGLSEGMSVDESVLFANSAASVSVTRKGAQPSMPKRSEVES